MILSCTEAYFFQQNIITVRGCHYLIEMQNQYDILHTIFLRNHIEPTTSARNLGILLDETLCLSPHISKICKSAVFLLRQISRIRDFLTQDAFKIIVHSLVTSRLDYCNAALARLPDQDIKRLQCIQNAAACLTTKTKRFDHISPILQELHWLPVSFRITFKILVLTYKAINNLAPSYLKSMLKQYTQLGLSGQPATCPW